MSHIINSCDTDLPGDCRPLGYTTTEAEGHDDVVDNKCAPRAIILPHHYLILAVVEELDVLGFGIRPNVELQGLCVVLEPIRKLETCTGRQRIRSGVINN